MNNPTRYLPYEEVLWLEKFKIMGQSERIKCLEMRSLLVNNFGKNCYFGTEIEKPWKNRK